jgi:predicted nucleic acid-binding protein
MRILLDTNVLARAAQPHHPLYQPAVDAVALLRVRGDESIVVPQNLYEFWVVATRPVPQNGLGFSAAQTQAELTRIKAFFVLIDDDRAILPRWEQLVVHYQVLGKVAHDARLVAAMLVHNIGHLLTFNPGDFQRFSAITVLTPQQVLLPPPPAP